jgi:ABC-type Fe3+/spermidine/putrescine transport system ATPase subunit
MLKLKNINKKLGRFALSGINIEIPEGEYFVLLGRSGSGKTQLLELIAGLSVPDSGEIWINNQDATRKKIQERPVGLVFQDYAIFPNMTVFGNIAYPLHSGKLKKSEINQKVNLIAEEMNISNLLERYTQNLSGGELQRVALARTLVNSPKLLLLDEPMASIDASLKDDIKRTLRQLNRNGLTIIHVTHDYREAVSLAGRVGVIHNGHIIQEGPPEMVFSRPVNKFVARYAGIRNFFRVKFCRENDSWKALCDGNLVFKISGNGFTEEGLIILKSEDIKITDSEPLPGFDNCFRGVIKEINPSEYGMEIAVDAGEIFYVDLPVNDFKSLQIRESSVVWITFPKEAAIALPGTG